MTVLSVLRATNTNFSLAFKVSQAASGNVRKFTTTQLLNTLQKPWPGMGNKMAITPSRFQWQKYKDMFHFYMFLGLIPGFALLFYVNVFIGPATLSEIPEGYVPKQEEYFSHPFTRFLASKMFNTMQEEYERTLHYLHEEQERRRMILLAKRVEQLMRERGDYPYIYAFNYKVSKYNKWLHEEREKTDHYIGSGLGGEQGTDFVSDSCK